MLWQLVNTGLKANGFGARGKTILRFWVMSDRTESGISDKKLSISSGIAMVEMSKSTSLSRATEEKHGFVVEEVDISVDFRSAEDTELERTLEIFRFRATERRRA